MIDSGDMFGETSPEDDSDDAPTAAELEDLDELVRARVRAATGHDLAWEVIRIGERT